jgi:hypothetical protein
MTGREKRANIAGWLDASTALTRTVIEALRAAEQMKGDGGRNLIECPPGVFKELLAAESSTARVASWLLDNSFKLD